jgi:hypothetical protein
VTTTTYLGSGDASEHRRDYRADWLDNLADDVSRHADADFVEDYTSVVRGEPIGSVVLVRLNEAGQAARIVVNRRPLHSVLLWSQLMGEPFAGTRYAQFFLSPNPEEHPDEYAAAVRDPIASDRS